MEKLARIHHFNFINFSYSAHSFDNDRKYQIEDHKRFTEYETKFISFSKLKSFVKKNFTKNSKKFKRLY